MPDEFAVHVSRQELYALEVPDTFETDGSFDVMLVNHGQSLHVHLHLDDTLSNVASIDASNHYVEGESQRAVRVSVDADRIPEDGLFGRLKVASSHGSRTRLVDVELEPPKEQSSSVEVDESLAKPQPKEESAPAKPTDGPDSRPELPVLALGAIALVVAILATVFIGDQLVLLGALVVVGGVLVALYFLLQEG